MLFISVERVLFWLPDAKLALLLQNFPLFGSPVYFKEGLYFLRNFFCLCRHKDKIVMCAHITVTNTMPQPSIGLLLQKKCPCTYWMHKGRTRMRRVESTQTSRNIRKYYYNILTVLLVNYYNNNCHSHNNFKFSAKIKFAFTLDFLLLFDQAWVE